MSPSSRAHSPAHVTFAVTTSSVAALIRYATAISNNVISKHACRDHQARANQTSNLLHVVTLERSRLIQTPRSRDLFLHSSEKMSHNHMRISATVRILLLTPSLSFVAGKGKKRSLFDFPRTHVLHPTVIACRGVRVEQTVACAMQAWLRHGLRVDDVRARLLYSYSDPRGGLGTLRIGVMLH
jgi:hypothetical protein